MAEKYIGIENEVTSFKVDACKEADKLDFERYFHRFRKKSDYCRAACTSVRSTTGNGYYTDGEELEILTPPIAINKGFATRLTDSLMIGRDRAAKSLKGIVHTGYSMHWNLTRGAEEPNHFFEGIYIPFHLFGLTPLSIGLNASTKGGNRHQLAGDHIASEEQINATALMLGAYSYAIDKEGHCPIVFGDACTSRHHFLLRQGRTTVVYATISEINTSSYMPAQEYLEIFYNWIEPIAKKLGTKKEAANLEEFIHGSRQLEIDKKEYYQKIKSAGGHSSKGIYLPARLYHEKNSLRLAKGKHKREIPLEGVLLGEYVRCIDYFEDFEWDKVRFMKKGKYFMLTGITNIYKAAHQINRQLPKFRQPSKLKTMPNDISSIVQQKIPGTQKCYQRIAQEKQKISDINNPNNNYNNNLVPSEHQDVQFSQSCSIANENRYEFSVADLIEDDFIIY